MQSENHKVLAAIVTFNGAETIRETLIALAEQTHPCDAFLIIDNASKDDTLGIVRELKINNLQINHRTINEGVGAAYNIAVNKAIDNNYDWLWLFDQDSICQPDCLEKLLAEAEIIKSTGTSPAALFPSHNLKAHPGHLLPPWKWNGREMIDIKTSEHADKNHTSVHTSMTSGALYNIALIKSEKGFREDFFIDFVDHEYHMRLTNTGHKLFWVNNARINHDLGKTKTNAMGQTINYHEPWRYYFIGRNMFYCYWMWGGFPAIFQLWQSVNKHDAALKTIEEFDHRAAWMFFKVGVIDSFFRRFYKLKPPRSVIQSIR